MSTLTVALPLALPDHALELSFVLSLDGRTVSQQGAAPLALLPKADATILVVPVQKLSFHNITLPQAPKARLRAALEGLLEDLLLEGTDSQALALAPDAQAKQKAWVASFDKAWLNAHLQAFEQAGHGTSRIVPQAWPQTDSLLMATGTPSDPWLVRADHRGVLCSPLASASFLCLGLDESQAVASPPEISQTVEQVIGRPVQLRSVAQALLESQNSPWDLAQFDIRLARQSPWQRRLGRSWRGFAEQSQWRPVRWGLMALLASQVFGLVGLAWMESRSISQKKGLQTRLFTQTFPQIKVVLDPAAQMQKELNLLRASSPIPTGSDLEAQLAALGTAINALADTGPVTPPQSLQFSAGSLSLKGMRLPPQANTLLIERLQAQGYKASWQDDTLSLQRAHP